MMFAAIFDDFTAIFDNFKAIFDDFAYATIIQRFLNEFVPLMRHQYSSNLILGETTPIPIAHPLSLNTVFTQKIDAFSLNTLA